MVLVSLALLPGCSSTHIKSSRTPAGMAAAPFRNIMVVGMDERPDFRNPFEHDAVGFLKERGVEGTASFTRFSFDEMKGDRAQVRQKLAAANVQSALIVRVTAQSDSVDGPPASLGDMDMQAVDEDRYNSFTTPGGDIHIKLRLGAKLYRVSDGVVIWSGLLDTILSEDYDSIVVLRGMAKTIVEQMAKDKVIP